MSIRDDLHIAITCMVIAFTRQGSLVRSQYRPPRKWPSQEEENPLSARLGGFFFCFLVNLKLGSIGGCAHGVPKMCPASAQFFQG